MIYLICFLPGANTYQTHAIQLIFIKIISLNMLKMFLGSKIQSLSLSFTTSALKNIFKKSFQRIQRLEINLHCTNKYPGFFLSYQTFTFKSS